MAQKKESTRTTESYEFILTHDDIVDLMNDQNVQLNNGNVLSTQVFETSMIKSSGAGGEIHLRQFKPDDKFIFRFNVVVEESTTDTYSDLDVVS